MEYYGRRIRIFVFICLITALVACGNWHVPPGRGTTPPQGQKDPSISLMNTVYDFGEVIQGERPVATFVFRNTGNGILSIDRAVVDTRFLTDVVYDTSIDPGDEGVLEATLDSNRVHGKVVSHITMHTNDKERPEVLLKVSAKVEPILAFKPPFTFVGQVGKDESFSGKAELLGRLVNEGKFATLTIHTSSPSIEAKIRHRKTKDKTIPFLEFHLRPELKAGTFKENITLVSEDPPAQAQLLLLGQKLGIIKVTPDRFEFFPRAGMKEGPRSILFECDKRFTITRTEDVSGLLDLSLRTIEEGRRYELTAILRSHVKGSFLGVIKVHTDLEEHPLIQIPVIGGANQPNKDILSR